MKKIFLVAALAAGLLLPSTKAFAYYVEPVAGSSSGALTASLFMLGEIGQLGLMCAIVSGFDPWTPLFPNVTYGYPTGPNGG